MSISVSEYSPSQEKAWKRILDESNGGTIFHNLDFLGYHGERFKSNIHHLLFNKVNTPFGIMPLAIFEEAGIKHARSPYGASYGGPVFERVLGYSECKEVVASLIDYLKANTIESLRLTLPIQPCYQKYSQTFLLALMELGFSCINRDISSVVDLNVEDVVKTMDKRARNMSRKAEKADVIIVNHDSIDNFWIVLTKTYAKLGKEPTHSLEEFKRLNEIMSENVYVDVAYYEGIPVAGIGHMVMNNLVDSSFYLCQDPEYQHLQALSLLILNTLVDSKNNGFKWFDFGTSSVQMKGRENLFLFKESFGAFGIFRETYEWKRS